MTKVYLWYSEGECVGHCSMEFEDGSYFSFWPNDSYNFWKYLLNQEVESS